MAWQLEQLEVGEFARNPLSSVVAELRFQPVLSIDQDSEKIAGFQEKIRSSFPTYNENYLQEINISTPNTFSAGSKKVYEFGNLSGSRQLRLTSGNLALVRTDHEGRADLIEEFQLAVESLYDVFKSISVTRLGVLYSNVIDKDSISAELGEQLEWSDLINSDYFPMHMSNTSWDNFQFSTQVTDAAPDGTGELAARYSLFRQVNMANNTVDTMFRLDIDRSELNPEIDKQNIAEVIESYSDDIYSLFTHVAKEKLLAWMRLKEF